MLENYEEFLKDFDEILKLLFESQKKYIKCKKGCHKCCDRGDYPFSQLEFSYLTQGYIKLPPHTKILVQQNIRKLLFEKKEWEDNYVQKNGRSQNSLPAGAIVPQRFEHPCPFLINGECCVYKYRGIICRTFGVCYYDDKTRYVRLPDCVHEGLNYSEFFNSSTNVLSLSDIPKVNLRIDRVLNSELAHKYNLDCGDIRPMLDWING